jgi:colicin import membrane protein
LDDGGGGGGENVDPLTDVASVANAAMRKHADWKSTLNPPSASGDASRGDVRAQIELLAAAQATVLDRVGVFVSETTDALRALTTRFDHLSDVVTGLVNAANAHGGGPAKPPRASSVAKPLEESSKAAAAAARLAEARAAKAAAAAAEEERRKLREERAALDAEKAALRVAAAQLERAAANLEKAVPSAGVKEAAKSVGAAAAE